MATFSSPPMHRCFKSAYAHEEMNAKKRHTMEDVHRIVPELLRNNNSIISYFGVYDGHGGRQIVDFLETNLENTIKEELLEPDEASIPERLTRSFLMADLHSKKLNIVTSGATAVIALLISEFSDDLSSLTRTLYCANVGDSRAVLVSDIKPEKCAPSTIGYYATRLSMDHRSEEESEQKRIRDAGGFITRNRVLGILAVTRSFGDHGMKDFVIAEPFITQTNLNSHPNAPMLILACDGVWDVFSDQEACDLLMETYVKTGPFPEAAEILVRLLELFL